MGTVSILIHSAVDFNLQIPSNAMTFLFVLALGWIALNHGRDSRTAEHNREGKEAGQER